jgi:hypothetical protein
MYRKKSVLFDNGNGTFWKITKKMVRFAVYYNAMYILTLEKVHFESKWKKNILH